MQKFVNIDGKNIILMMKFVLKWNVFYQIRISRIIVENTLRSMKLDAR